MANYNTPSKAIKGSHTPIALDCSDWGVSKSSTKRNQCLCFSNNSLMMMYAITKGNATSVGIIKITTNGVNTTKINTFPIALSNQSSKVAFGNCVLNTSYNRFPSIQNQSNIKTMKKMNTSQKVTWNTTSKLQSHSQKFCMLFTTLKNSQIFSPEVEIFVRVDKRDF